MCASCLSHLLADARLKDETPTCPGCRCAIDRTLCSRNLAVEKAISELPALCQFCARSLPRSMLPRHETDMCPERFVGRCPSPDVTMSCNLFEGLDRLYVWYWWRQVVDRHFWQCLCSLSAAVADDVHDVIYFIDVGTPASHTQVHQTPTSHIGRSFTVNVWLKMVAQWTTLSVLVCVYVCLSIQRQEAAVEVKLTSWHHIRPVHHTCHSFAPCWKSPSKSVYTG